MGLNRHLPPMPQPLMRLEGWELRMVGVIERARARPYRLGEHDCFRFALEAVAALTGHDHWPHLAGRYHDRMSAARLILEHGPSFEETFSYCFGTGLVPVRRARRGDIVLYKDAEPHLGLCVGGTAALLKEDGLSFVPLIVGAGAWRIG